ncbi:unnamed protein product, partial [Anisakis simplex]|uniref:Apple domain-containing protein n=1 Tax=Anisakis simplex TaxID=6269 RepID=A0A0M3JKG6_ANISI
MTIPVPMHKWSVGAVYGRCQMDTITSDTSSSCTITSGQNTFPDENTDSAGREMKPQQQQQNHGNAAGFAGFYCMIFTLATLLTTVQAVGRCYLNGPGTSIQGADYRRDYDITLRHCAITCREDPCCMAFEWLSDGMCTLKTRSLNGTISNV